MAHLKLVGGTDITEKPAHLSPKSRPATLAPSSPQSESESVEEVWAKMQRDVTTVLDHIKPRTKDDPAYEPPEGEPLAMQKLRAQAQKEIELHDIKNGRGVRLNADPVADSETRRIILAHEIEGKSVRAIIQELYIVDDPDAENRGIDPWQRSLALKKMLEPIGVFSCLADESWGMDVHLIFTVAEPKKLVRAIPALRKRPDTKALELYF